MPRVKLTDATVRSAKPIDGRLTEYADTKENGLALRVTPAGVRSWTFRYRTKAGQQKRLSLGKADDISLAEARARVRKYRGQVADGRDPVAEAQQAKQDAIDALDRETVQEVGRWYFAECEAGRHRPNARQRKRQSTIDSERYYFERHILPGLGDRKLADLTRAMVQKFVNEVEIDGRHSPSTARQCRVILHAIFAFAIRQEIVDANPVQFVTVPSYAPRERVLTDEEMRAIWRAMTPPIAIEGAAVSANVACAVLLAMVTLQRRGEIAGMRLSEIDRDRRLWTIPGTRTKNHRTHAVPLSDLALELIDKAASVRPTSTVLLNNGREAPVDHLFPSPRDPSRPIEAAAITRAFGRMRKALNLGDIRPHDLRRTGATHLTGERLGFPRFIVSRVLNHVSDTGGAAKVTAVYDTNEYLAEKRRALDAWAMRLIEIAERRPPASNVVPLHEAGN